MEQCEETRQLLYPMTRCNGRGMVVCESGEETHLVDYIGQQTDIIIALLLVLLALSVT